MPTSFFLAALLLAAAPAAAQNIAAVPLYGTVDLAAGFAPDPYTVEVLAGGGQENPVSGPDCAGMINAERPDVDLNYSAGTFPLTIGVLSDDDTTLLVNLPNGEWICSDDAAGTNPAVELANPMSGNYNIWVGTYWDDGTRPATVFFSERSTSSAAGGAVPSPGMPDVSAAPLYETVTLPAGFQPDPYRISLTAGGGDENPVSGPGCAGMINAERPDVDLNYSAGSYPLYIYVDSSSDTTLLVNLPSGEWVCSDDDGAGTNPLIRLSSPLSGNYNIWVGTYGDATSAATLYLSEVAP